MPINITPEQYRELLNKLPKETQDLILSEETAMSVFDSCMANDVDVDKISEVGRYADYVLVGAIKEDDLANALEKEVGLEKDTAKKIAEDITADVFSKIGEKPTAAAVSMSSEEEIDEEMEEKPRRKDTYRETVE